MQCLLHFLKEMLNEVSYLQNICKHAFTQIDTVPLEIIVLCLVLVKVRLNLRRSQHKSYLAFYQITCICIYMYNVSVSVILPSSILIEVIGNYFICPGIYLEYVYASMKKKFESCQVTVLGQKNNPIQNKTV